MVHIKKSLKKKKKHSHINIMPPLPIYNISITPSDLQAMF